ncbi:MAG: DUF1175 family protein [Blastocatellia bacterium]|nr:DUF1175 family protein [Blastocatellia bacterium]
MRRAPALLLLACALLASVSMAGGCSGGSRVRSREVAPVVAGCPLCEDGDNDGMPDAAELRSFDDRNNFRKWFTAIAEMQFYRMADSWNPTQRDCAGLVRYAWREALRRHDRLWFQAMGEGWEMVAPDVRAYQLEGGPLGEKLFRAEFGSFQAGDLEAGRFSEFADARTLKNYNVFPLGHDRRRAQAGDLLFFHQPGAQKYPYHVMIFLGAARIAGEGAADWVVYHTGASLAGASSAGAEAEDAGEVKKVRLATLDRHPDPRWRPVERNRNFLGFYRLKILE